MKGVVPLAPLYTMGRQAYLNRLALGRSPYEPPETATVDPSSPVRRVSSVHADNYMQQYDARGHPVNPQSKALGRDLRRAKNDILSTMGVVVSGEDRNASSSNEQRKINETAAENDFGLVITTLDQLFVFFGTWWSSSLTGRIQTFRHYTHAALFDVIRSERGSTGILGFYLAGIPAWAVSSGLAIARENPLKHLFIAARDYFLDLAGAGGLSLSIRSFFGLTYSVTRSSILLLSVEAYMYSLLQTLSLVPSDAIPNLRLLIPFGAESLIQLPPLPSDVSLLSAGNFVLRLATSPGVLTFLFAFCLRPELEERIYRLVRRHLPKPACVDEHSIKVAFDEDLIDWIIPSLGRRSTEEMRRSKLTLFEDIKYEVAALRSWLASFFGLSTFRMRDPLAIGSSDREKLESLRNSIETLQHELDEFHLQNNPAGNESENTQARPLEGLTSINTVDAARPDLPVVTEPTPMSETELALGMPQVLMNENRMAQSPGEMSSDYFSEMATLGRTSAPSTNTRSQSQPSNTQIGDNATRDRQDSRSNTLFSRPSSPETSPPTSPRVRASLIHQSSDIITMQLELLGNRNRNAQNRPSTSNLIPSLSPDRSVLRPYSSAVDRRPIAEFLEALILSQAQRQAAQQPSQAENDGLSTVTGGASYTTAQEVPIAQSGRPNRIQQAMAAEHPVLNAADETPAPPANNIIPDGVEEPPEENTNGQRPPSLPIDPPAIPADPTPGPPAHTPRAASQPAANQHIIAHRVTLLSVHPVDSLASHLAAVISTIILSPLETLCLRSLAYSHLSTRPSHTAQLSDLHPTGLWLGGRSWSDRAAYAGRVVLMRGMQAALRAGLWGFLVGSTMRIGRKFCGWGTL